MISNSGSDERGKLKGGQAGDQTGAEWQIRPWYNRPWTHILRHPDAKVRALLAELGEESARNNNIGYDQDQRATYWTQLQKVGYRPSKIIVKCEADCSAGVIANIKAVGHLLGITKLKNLQASYTGDMRKGLINAGFQVLTASKYLTSENYLLRGDILLKEGSHTATALTNGKYSGGTSTSVPTPSPSPTATKKSDIIKAYQKFANANYAKILKNHTGGLLVEDGVAGNHTLRSAITIWKDVMNRLHGAKLTLGDYAFGEKCKTATKKVPLRQGESGTLVAIAQLLLALNSYYTYRFDCAFDSQMGTATYNFQADKGIKKDKVIDAETMFKLFNQVTIK